jgi:UDP:flavonoid glycosyltransferase YjiC (YdhE family)
MGKAVFLNLPGATGHINPALGIVAELIRRGEAVIFYADPGSAAKFTALGATARDYRRWSDYDHDPATAADLIAVGIALFEMTEQCLLGLLQELEAERPDYIIYDSCAPWGPLLADRLGIPAIKFVTHVLWTSRMTFDGAPANRAGLQRAAYPAAGCGSLPAPRQSLSATTKVHG